MKFMRIFCLLCCLFVSCTQSVEGETVVHNDREGRNSKYHEIVSDVNVSSEKKRETASDEDNFKNKAQKNDISEKGQIEDLQSIDNSHADITEDYFETFEKRQPEFSTSFGEGGDLAGLSSISSCQSTYSMSRLKEYIGFMLFKSRDAWAFGSDVYLFFCVNINLDIPLVINKNKQPVFEIDISGEKKIVKLKKISDYSNNRFSVRTSNVNILDELYVPHAKVTMLIQTKNGSVVRIPIPENVVQQWEEVTSADLKKMKKDYEAQ